MLFALALAQATVAPVAPPVILIRPYKIVLIGDSTTQVHTGWGGSFCAQRVTSITACVNLARGGRSTKSYRAEGSWAVAVAEAKVPGYVATYVLIQFGHNDQPGKPGRSTDLVTEFPANLTRYVAEVRAAGARPILLTPLTRRTFANGQLTRELDAWAAAVRRVATETGTPLVDLNARSAAVIEAMGPVTAAHYAPGTPDADTVAAALTGTTSDTAPTPPAAPPAAGSAPPVGVAANRFDYTHLNREGADLFGGIVAGELARVVPEMRPLLVP